MFLGTIEWGRSFEGETSRWHRENGGFDPRRLHLGRMFMAESSFDTVLERSRFIAGHSRDDKEVYAALRQLFNSFGMFIRARYHRDEGLAWPVGFYIGEKTKEEAFIMDAKVEVSEFHQVSTLREAAAFLDGCIIGSMIMKKPLEFQSMEHLVRAVEMSMPDEYPSGMAEVFAEAMLKEGKAVIRSPENEDP